MSQLFFFFNQTRKLQFICGEVEHVPQSWTPCVGPAEMCSAAVSCHHSEIFLCYRREGSRSVMGERDAQVSSAQSLAPGRLLHVGVGRERGRAGLLVF